MCASTTLARSRRSSTWADFVMLKDSGRVDFHTGQPEEVPNAKISGWQEVQRPIQNLATRPLYLDVMYAAQCMMET